MSEIINICDHAPDVLTLEDVFLALLIAATITTVYSVPGIIMTVYRSSRSLKRYRVIRSIEGMGILPTELIAEWENVRSAISYSSMISDELERLGSLRPALFQTSISAVLLAIVIALADLEHNALIAVIIMLILCIISVVIGRINAGRYAEEYEGILAELESNGDESCGNMYG